MSNQRSEGPVASSIAVAVELPSLADEAELMTWLEDNCSDCDE
jgi:hypothetical protein